MVLRAGLAGLGSMGRNHARVLQSLEGVELVATADPAGDRFDSLGGVAVVPDLHALLGMNLDYVVIALPTALHETAALACAEAGVAALIEKPLATDAAAAQRVATAFNDRGLVGAVGHIERYNPSLQQARRRIGNGDLGEILQIATRRLGPFPARISDVGVVRDLGTHDIDLTAWVAQRPYVSVAAQTAHRSGRPHEDLVSITGLLADGIVTSHLISWLSPFKERQTVITGDRGTFIADTLSADLTFYENGSVLTGWDAVSKFRGVSEGDVIRYAFAKPEPLRVEHETFRDAVLGLDADIVTLEQGMQTVRVADAVAQSASAGQTVAV